MAAQEGPLLEDSTPEVRTLACGIDCAKLLAWRGTGSNRTFWKAMCSAALSFWFALYFWAVQESWSLCFVGALSCVKFLVEIWGQDTPTWVCPGGWPMFLLVYTLGFPGVGYYCSACVRHPDLLIPHREIAGVFFFLFGSGYAMSYELSRFAWKKCEENKGKLHTVGHASLCIHPNYLGDLFTYTGWALCCGTSCVLSAPIFMVWMFVLFVCPNSDAYLASRYPDQFPSYAARTATLLPGLRGGVASSVVAWACFVLACFASMRCPEQCSG